MKSRSNVAPTGNPIIRHKYTTDPTVIVYRDTVYLYTGHDEPEDGIEDYVMRDWLCFSSKDLIHWQEHPIPLRATDFAWAKGSAFASKVLQHNDRFLWYAAVDHRDIPGMAIGVAVAENPEGPFHDARGEALIDGRTIPPTDNEKANLDPAVYIDEDGQAYIFWGNGACYYSRLKKDMTELEGAVQTLSLPGFEEGAHIHRHKDWYYLSYGYGFPEKVAYAMSRSIEGPWEFKGILNEIAGNCVTNRPAIVAFKGASYFFYHNGALPGGGSHRRSVCIDRLHYNPDGTMQRVVMTSEGISPG